MLLCPKTSPNTANTDTPAIEMDYRGRSIAFAATKIDLLIGGKSNGGVCRNVMCHAERR
jgi:hypothetical protein